ncbi:MAG TPA: universal stress protein [Candidatus Limnocylindria bacterium]|nr:universal stress protein [Candidatus Limnocylindria bacterium]
MVATGAAVREKAKVSLARILVATDFSPASDRALEFGISLARRYNSQIYLTHVITLDAYPMVAPELATESEAKQRREAEGHFEEIEKSGRLFGLRRETVLAEGSLWPTIEDLVKKYEIELVIVGTHGASGLEKVVIGSNAEQIFRQARIPVLTVGPAVKSEAPYEVEFRNILFATDFGPGAEREAAFAFSLAQEHRARLTLLNVAPYAEDYSEQAVARKREAVTKQLRELLPTVPEFYCSPEYVMVIGDPVEEILRWSKLTHADLIVMGAKSRKGLAGHIPHTKAQRIITAATCPVLTVKS